MNSVVGNRNGGWFAASSNASDRWSLRGDYGLNLDENMRISNGFAIDSDVAKRGPRCIPT